jgi:hypothetical protein
MALLRRRKTIGPAFGYAVTRQPPAPAGSALAFAVTATPTVLTSAFANSVFTFSGCSIGAAASDRIVVVCASASGFRNTTGVTIDGSAMTLAVSNGASNSNAIWYKPWPTGTTATIVITLDVVGDYAGCMVGRLVGCSGAPTATQAFNESVGWDPHAFPSPITVPTGGALIVFAVLHPDSSLPQDWSAVPALIDDGIDPGGAWRASSGTFLNVVHTLTAGSITPSVSSLSPANDFGYGGSVMLEAAWGP